MLLAFCRLVDDVLDSKIFGESCGGTDDVDIIWMAVISYLQKESFSDAIFFANVS